MKSVLLGLATAGMVTFGALAQEVAVITPFLAQPGTQMYLEGFQKEATEKGWDVNVIDTAGGRRRRHCQD